MFPAVFLKLVCSVFVKFFWFICTVLWIILNLLKFLALKFMKLLSQLERFLIVHYENSFDEEEERELSDLTSLDEDDEQSTNSPELHGSSDAGFGDLESAYEDQKKYNFTRIFYFSSFYFAKKSSKRGTPLGTPRQVANELPYFSLNKFIWSKSRYFDRPFSFSSFLRYKNDNTYNLLKNTKYYKHFFDFINKSQKYEGIINRKENFFFVKLPRSLKKKAFCVGKT